MNVKKLKQQSRFIISTTFFVIFTEAIFGGLLIYFLFRVDWLIAFIASLAFATVGEVILIPILDEFKITKTSLGQTIIGIGLLDDIVELILLIAVIALIGTNVATALHPIVIVCSILILFILTIGLSKLRKAGRRFRFLPLEPLLLFVLALLFLFIGIGAYAEAASLAALLAGISVSNFLPPERLQMIEKEVHAIGYGLFAPIFFIWAGSDINIGYILSAPLLVLLVIVVTNGAKVFSSYLAAHKRLGARRSILLGIGLSVRFSLSIIIVKILLDNKLIGEELYSVILASSIVFQFIVPIMFSQLLVRWKLAPEKTA